MKKVFDFLSALMFVAFSGPIASANEGGLALCSVVGMQEMCPLSCAQLGCADEGFLANNVSFCVANFFDEDKLSQSFDDKSCRGIFNSDDQEKPVDDPGVPLAGDTSEVENAGEDCSALGDIFAQEECELQKLAPSCSRTVVELEGRSALLVTDIKAELASYGELLTRDYGDVKNRGALCEFTRDDLSASFKLASENPAVLRSLQRQAQDVQACQTDWEDVVRGYRDEGTSDSLIDTLVRGSEAKLEELKTEIASLSTSVAKLENAAGTIRGIIRLYVAFCPG